MTNVGKRFYFVAFTFKLFDLIDDDQKCIITFDNQGIISGVSPNILGRNNTTADHFCILCLDGARKLILKSSDWNLCNFFHRRGRRYA